MIILGKIFLVLLVILGLSVIEESVRQKLGIVHKAPDFWSGVAFKLVQMLFTILMFILYLYLFFYKS